MSVQTHRGGSDYAHVRQVLERHAQPELLAFWLALEQTDPPGAAGWAVGDVTRSAADQAQAVADGLSWTDFPNSPHNHPRSYALDVWPTDPAGNVIEDPTSPAYQTIAELASQFGLATGAPYDDHGHVYIPDWIERTRRNVARAGFPKVAAVLGGLWLVAWLIGGRRD